MNMEPPEKQQKFDECELKELLLNMQSSYLSKLKSIEDKVEAISSKYTFLERKVENILIKAKESSVKTLTPNLSSCPSDAIVPRFIAANCEETFPNGCWLGDPNDFDTRVRCNISPIDLAMINNTCTTAEKMALTLLDHLFDRETQARSNISGTGKHAKDQLDPLKIYGIKCHIMYKFDINQKEWYRIRQNIDSKCRTAFRRKQKGLPLYAKRCKEKDIRFQPTKTNCTLSNGDSQCESNLLENSLLQGSLIPKTECDYVQEHELDSILPLKMEQEGYSLTFTDALGTQIIHTEHGDIQVIQATEEQLEQLKQSHHIEILSQADILTDVLDTTQ